MGERWVRPSKRENVQIFAKKRGEFLVFPSFKTYLKVGEGREKTETTQRGHDLDAQKWG